MIKFIKSGVSTSPLFCDKLSFVIQYATLAEQSYICNQLQKLSKNEHGHFAGPKGKAKYKCGMAFFVEEWERVHTMLVQASPKSYGDHFFRADFNPAHADPTTVRWLLENILPGGWYDVATRGRCTRFDATVDVTGIDIMELLVCYSGKQLSRAFHKGGRLETLDMGAYAGDKHVVVYDKCAEVKHHNLTHKIKLPVPVGPVTRIEIAMRPSVPFDAFAKASNPFANLNIYSVPPMQSAQTLEFQLFVKVAQLGGLQSALLGLPESKRKQFKAKLDLSSQPWWDPEIIWATWSSLLHSVLQLPDATDEPLAA